MTELEKRAQKIIDKKTRTKEATEQKLAAGMAKNLLQLKNEFIEGFGDVLDLLLAAGIGWEAKYQDPLYTFKGGYIEFTLKDKSLKMDFSSADSYRLCYVPYEESRKGVCPMVYSDWSKDAFIVWVYRNLMVEEEVEA